jgi:hypothetical protein
MSHNPKLGLFNNARSPGSIQNMEHHDPSGSQKSINGSPATVLSIIPDSTVKTPIHPYAVLRVVNTTGATAFFLACKDSDMPGALTALNALAIPPNSAEVFHCGASDEDLESIVCKASVIGVQVAVMDK